MPEGGQRNLLPIHGWIEKKEEDKDEILYFFEDMRDEFYLGDNYYII